MGEFDDLIKQLTEAGATDEEIVGIINEQLALKGSQKQPGSQVSPDVTRRAAKTAFGMLPGVNIPVLGDLLLDTSVAVQSAISDQLPQMVISDQMRIMRKRHEEMKRTINSLQDPINKQKMIEIYASILGVTPSSNIDDMLTEYSLRQEGEIAAQKQEAQQKLTGIAAVQDIAEVNSATKLAQYIGNSIGQALGQIPVSVATLGKSSIIMEQGIVYDEQLQRIADELGISREEVIRRGLDDPDGGQQYALIAAGLDAISAGRVLKLFKSSGLGKVTQNLVNSLFEGTTEAAQGVLEDVGAAEGSGTEFEFDSGKTLNEFLAGTIGGGGISIMTPSEAEEITAAIKEEEKQIMAEASTGVPDLDRTIDQLADEDVKEINRIADKELEIAGSKLEQQLREAQEEKAKAVARQIAAEKEAQAAQAEVDRRQFIDQTRENFAASPTLTPTDLRPGDVAAEEEALIQDVEILGVDPITRRFIPKPPIQNAIQIKAAGQVPIQSGAGSSQKMAQGEPQSEPQSAAQAGSVVGGEVDLGKNTIIVNMSLPFDSGVNTGLVKNSKGAVYHDRNTSKLEKLGYSKEQIDKLSQAELDEILAKNIENPNVETSAKMPLAEEQTTTQEFLNEASKEGGRFAELAKALKQFFGIDGVETEIVKGLKDFFGKKNDGDYANNKIRIDEKAKNKLQTFLHEAIHKVTVDKLSQFERGDYSKLSKQDIEAIQNLTRIFNESKVKIHEFLGGGKGDRTKGHYGFTNVHEFISEAFTNPEFQSLLKNLPTEGNNPTIFKQFLDAVAKFLGLKDASILNDIFYYTENLNNKAEEDLIGKAPTQYTEAAGDLAAKKADIERRRQEELDKLNVSVNKDLKIAETFSDKIPQAPTKLKLNQGLSDKQVAIKTANERLEFLTKEINAKYDAELAALEAAAPATKTEPQAPTPEEGLVFTTEKGSVYTVEGQKTTRNKAKREGHEDSGPKQQSFATVYLTPTDAQKAQVIYTGGVTSRTINRDGNEVVVTDVLENGAIKTTRFPYQKTPQIGLHPFEVFEDGGAHLGNKITNISKPSRAPAETKPVEKRIVGPVTLEDIEIESQDKDGNPITKKATKFTFSDDSGTATGNIVGKAASILEIYAATDQEGNAKRGGNLYGKVIDNLKKQGVKTVVVGMQSPASQAALAKQVEKDVLRPSTKGVMQIGGRSLPTRFNIVDTPNPKPPKVKKTKAPEKKEPVISKVAQKSEEDIEASRVRLSNLIANAVRSSEKPGKKEARLRELAARADEANFEDLYETAFSEAEKISKKREEYKKDRAERAENKKKRDANKKTREERRAEKQKAREEKEERLAKTTQRPVAVKTGMISKEDTQMPLQKAKDAYLSKIAYFGNRGDKINYEAAIDEYINFRKINNLQEVSREKIRKQIQTEKAVSGREKIRKDISSDRARLRDTIESIERLQADLEKVTTKEEADKINKKIEDLQDRQAELSAKLQYATKPTTVRQADQAALEAQAKKDVAEALGIDENSIDDVDFMFGFRKDGTTLRDKVIDYLEDNKIDSNTRNEISFEQFVQLAPPAQSNILNAIYRVVQKYKTKEKSNTKFYTVYVGDNAPFAGIHVSLKNSDNAYILIAVDENGKPVGQRYNRNTVLHEILHDYTKLMLTRAFKLDKSFKSKIQRTFYTLKEELSKQIEQLAKDLNKGKTLTTKQETLYSAVRMYYPELLTSTPSFEGGVYREGNFVANVDNYEDTFYAFTNEEELLSEVFSDPRTVAFLSQVEMNEKITTGVYKGQTKSLLYKWFEDLFSFVKRNFKLTPVQNNAIDYVLDAVVEYDVPFNEEILERNEVQREFDIVSLSKAVKDNDEVLKKLKSEEKKVKRNARVVAKIVGSLERRRKEITSFNDVKEYINRVNNRLPEYRRLGDTYVDITWKLIQRRRAKRDQMAGIQKEFIRKGKESVRYASSIKYRQDVDDFASVSLDNLTMAEIKTYINGLNALAHDQTIQQAAYNLMISKGKMLNKKQEMLKISDKIRRGSSWIASLTSPATFSTILGKYNDSVSQTILKNIYGGLMAANARSGIEGYLFYKKLSDLATKLKLTHANLAKIGAYGSIFSTKSDPADKAAWTAEVLENAEFQLSAANAKLQSLNEKTYKRDLNKTRIEEELSVVQKLVDKIRANVSMDGILTPQETQLYNEIRKFADEHEQDFFRNTIGSWGKTPPKLFNYFPRIAQGKVGGIKSDEMQNDALIRSDADNLMEALSGNNATYEDIAGKKAFSTHERINAKGYYYDLDALSIGKIWSKSMLYDMYATTELKALNRLLKDPEFRRAMGVDLQGQFFDHLKSITGAGYRYDPTVSPLVRKLMKARDTLYTATLATGGQIFLQSSSGLVGAAVITAHLGSRGPKALSKAIAATAKVQTGNTELEKFMNERGLGIQIRDVLFEKYLSPDDFGRGVGLKKAVNEVQNATEFALRQGDKLAARLVWFAAYFDAGGTLEKPSEEAILKAERITGLLQNMSDVNMSAPIFRNNTAAKRILVGMFMAFKGFALNAYINTWYAARNLNEETARRVFISQLGSILAYHTLQAYVVRSAYDWMLDAIDGDDDEEEDEKRVSKQKEIIWSAAWDAAIGGAAPSIIDNYARYMVVNLAGDKLWGDPYEDFDKYKDSPLFSPQDPWDLDKAIGPGYRDVGDLVRATTEAMVAAKEAEDTLTAAEMITGVSDSNEKAAFKANQAVLKVMATATGSIVSIPFRGDFKRLLEKAAQKRREQRRKEKSMTSGGQPIEDRDLFMNGQDNMPEMYEEKNYDLIDY